MLIWKKALWALLVLICVPAAATGQEEEAPTRMIPGAEWMGKGVNLLGIYLDQDGNPQPFGLDQLQKKKYMLKGLGENQAAEKYYRKRMAMKGLDAAITFRIPMIFQVLQSGAASTATSKTVVSTSVHELHTQTSTEYCVEPSYKLFSGKFKHTSTSQRDHSTTNYYAWSLETTPDYLLVLDDDVDLTEHLSRTFKRLLNDPDHPPAKLFKSYGTHLVRELALGRRKEMTTVKLATEDTTEDTVRTEVEVGFEGFLSASVNTESTTKRTDRVSNATTSEDTLGFDGTPAILGFKREDEEALVPIWELCEDKERKKQIREEYHTMAALAAIAAPVVFSKPAGNDGSDPTHPQMTLGVKRGYKIISGGAQVTSMHPDGVAIISSHPEGSRTWKARGCASNQGKIAINVVAIYDPHNYWEIVHEEKIGKPATSTSTWVEIARPGRTSGGTIWTGGGARIETNHAWTSLTQSAPLDASYLKMRFPTPLYFENRAKVVKAHYRKLALTKKPYPVSGWVAEAWDHGESVTGNVNSYLIGVQPHSKRNGRYARKIEAKSMVFLEHSGRVEQVHSAEQSALVADGVNLTLVGGGAFTLGQLQYVTMCWPVQKSAEEVAWHTRGANWNSGARPDDFYYFAIGIQARIVPTFDDE